MKFKFVGNGWIMNVGGGSCSIHNDGNNFGRFVFDYGNQGNFVRQPSLRQRVLYGGRLQLRLIPGRNSLAIKYNVTGTVLDLCDCYTGLMIPSNRGIMDMTWVFSNYPLEWGECGCSDPECGSFRTVGANTDKWVFSFNISESIMEFLKEEYNYSSVNSSTPWMVLRTLTDTQVVYEVSPETLDEYLVTGSV